MKLKIYQIDLDRDTNAVAFMSLDALSGYQENEAVQAEIYDKVYESTVDAKDLEDVYRIFNLEKPEDFCGRSLSVSDVVEVTESDNVAPGFYYCDRVGFRAIGFEPEKSREQESEQITVVMCEPGKTAYVTEIGTHLEDLQAAVGGCIETYYPFESEEVIVCNDEGKINGMEPCRGIHNDEGELMDIIFGRFFICDCSGESFGSLSEEKQKEYMEKFRSAEHFFSVGGQIRVIKYEPRGDAAER